MSKDGCLRLKRPEFLPEPGEAGKLGPRSGALARNRHAAPLLSRVQVKHSESGKHFATLAHAFKIADALGSSGSDLTGVARTVAMWAHVCAAAE